MVVPENPRRDLVTELEYTDEESPSLTAKLHKDIENVMNEDWMVGQPGSFKKISREYEMSGEVQG